MTKSEKEPWKQVPKVWPTEAKFWGWVRGVLRKGWSRHPVKIEYISLNRKRITNPNEKTRKRFPVVWGMTCEICGVDHLQTNIEIDHVEGNSKFTCLDDMKSYAEHLFMVDFKSLRALCKPCHKIKTHSESKGITFEEARLEKQSIEICKQSPKEILAWLQEMGYDVSTVKNASNRRVAVSEVLRKGLK